MKTIKLLFVALLAVAMTACVEDKVYEGPNTIEAVSINPDAPTSFDDVVVTAKVSGLLDVTKAVLRYSVNDDFVEELDMDGNGTTYTATIPAQEDGTKVNYVVIITNEAGYTTTAEREYTVGDKPSDYTKLVINELYGAGEDGEKYIELYNIGQLQWEMIKWSLETKCDIYDFRGVSGDLTPDNPLYGLYLFKKGFSGDLCEFCGEFEMVYKPAVDLILNKGLSAARELRRKIIVGRKRKAAEKENKPVERAPVQTQENDKPAEEK